ncbi:hypothetical protein WJX79_002699 [Trebouxia sp. C0005]
MLWRRVLLSQHSKRPSGLDVTWTYLLSPSSDRKQEIRQHRFSAVAALPIIHHPAYSKPQLPDGHRFPMGVFQRVHDLLIEDQVIQASQVHVPAGIATDDQLHMVHDKDFVARFSNGTLSEAEVRRIGFGEVTRHPDLIERTKAEVAGTLLTAELALQHGLACNTAGGTHHAFPSFGSGFCILNDLAVTAEVLLHRNAVDRVLILDLDVHQGDGTAFIFQGRKDVFTLSMHAANNFPARKQNSTLDVPLPDGMEDDDYLRTVAEVVSGVLQDFRPDLVLYDAGVDPHADDKLGRLKLTDNGLMRREMQVLDSVMAAGIPIAGNIGGGYHPDLTVLARRHCLLHWAATQMFVDHKL